MSSTFSVSSLSLVGFIALFGAAACATAATDDGDGGGASGTGNFTAGKGGTGTAGQTSAAQGGTENASGTTSQAGTGGTGQGAGTGTGGTSGKTTGGTGGTGTGTGTGGTGSSTGGSGAGADPFGGGGASGAPGTGGGAGGSEPDTCVHPACSTGAKLTKGCSSCVDTVCAKDSFCCTVSWDSTCVTQAKSAGCCTPTGGGTGEQVCNDFNDNWTGTSSLACGDCIDLECGAETAGTQACPNQNSTCSDSCGLDTACFCQCMTTSGGSCGAAFNAGYACIGAKCSAECQ